MIEKWRIHYYYNRNQKIQSLQIIDNIYIYNYTTEKYKRKMCYHQKNNSDIKTFKRTKNIKES